MSDITQVTLLKSLPSVPQPASTQGGASQDGKILVNVPSGTVLTGFIVNRDGSGNPILRTQNGDIPFASQFFLKIGSEVTLRVENAAGGNTAHILSVDGQSPQVAENTSAFAHDPEVVLGDHITGNTATATEETGAIATAPVEEPAITVNGILISNSAPNASTPSTLASLPVGTQLTLKIVTLTAPANASASEIPTQPTQAATSAPTGNASYAAYARNSGNVPVTYSSQTLPAAAASVPASPTPTIISAENIVTAPNVAFSTPQSAIASPISIAPSPLQPTAANPASNVPAQSPALATNPTNTNALTFQAKVIGNEPSGESLLQTPFGIVRLQPDHVLPTGSNAVFELEETTIPLPSNATTSLTPEPLTALAQHWESLQQIIALLPGDDATDPLAATINTANAYNANNNVANNAASPIATPQTIAGGVLFFLSALHGGTIENWLGRNNVKWLQDQGHGDLLKKAQSEFTSVKSAYESPVPHGWQALFFPVAVDGMVQQVRFFTKREKNASESQEENPSEDTRFVVEVDLSRLGEIQMDGFVRRAPANVQFDLVIRSLMPLSPEVQQDILRIYNDTGAITGYQGGLSFQSVKAFPINPMEDIATAMPTLVA